MLERYNQALEYCDLVLEQDDRHWRTYSNRAVAYMRLERYEEARRDLDRGQEISPNATVLRKVRAALLDATQPVTPRIEIDDRRQPPRDDNAD